MHVMRTVTESALESVSSLTYVNGAINLQANNTATSLGEQEIKQMMTAYRKGVPHLGQCVLIGMVPWQ